MFLVLRHGILGNEVRSNTYFYTCLSTLCNTYLKTASDISCKSIVDTNKTPPTKKELKYHGVLWASKTENGDWISKRNGKIIKIK